MGFEEQRNGPDQKYRSIPSTTTNCLGLSLMNCLSDKVRRRQGVQHCCESNNLGTCFLQVCLRVLYLQEHEFTLVHSNFSHFSTALVRLPSYSFH